LNLFNSTFILTNKRFAWIDYDRGISIILVTFRHCFEGLMNSGIDLNAYPFLGYLNVFLFGFRMPLFFIASGLFVSSSLKKKGLLSYSNNRFKLILYPLLVWGTIQISLQLLFSSHSNSEVHPIDYIYLLINPRKEGQFWYLNALFFVGLIYAYLKEVARLKLFHQITIGFCLYFLLSFIRSANLDFGLLMDVFQYYVFFAIGDALSGYIHHDKSSNILSSWIFFAFLLFIFLFVQYFFTKINLSNHSDYYVQHKMPFFFLLVAAVGCLLSINISFLLKRYNKFPFLRVIGYHSVHMYCMQIIIMALVRLLLMKIFGITFPPLLVLLVFFSGIFLPIIIYNLSLRFNLWWLFSLNKPVDDIRFLTSKGPVLSD
jgi:fucose 4-O-acetylase-like acetyltransferase